MKRYVTISLFVFWAVVVAIMTAGLVFYQNQKTVLAPVGENAGEVVCGLDGTACNASSTKIVLDAATIAKHNTEGSCWQIIGGEVFDLTSYIPKHPAGPEKVIAWCGKDATKVFDSVEAHARAALQQYSIGKLNSTIQVKGTASADVIASGSGQAPTKGLVNTAVQPANSTTVLSKAEVAKHNSAASCWQIIGGSVYDLTAYAPRHPAGPAKILALCGQDSTAAFDAVGAHARSALGSFLLGGLDQSVSNQPAASQPTATVSSNDDDEEDDD